MKVYFQACCLLFFCCSSRADIIKFDEEDMRDLRAADPLVLLTFPPSYAFTQAAQITKANGFQYFSFLFYECKIGAFETTAVFEPPSYFGSVLDYSDDWIQLQIIAYSEPPSELDVFDACSYDIVLEILHESEDTEEK